MVKTTKLKYRLNILNTTAFFYIAGCLIHSAANYAGMSADEGWGIAYMMVLTVFGLSALVVDLVLQKIFKRKSSLNMASSIALGIYVILFFLGTR
jgi:hypothetical protein